MSNVVPIPSRKQDPSLRVIVNGEEISGWRRAITLFLGLIVALVFGSIVVVVCGILAGAVVIGLFFAVPAMLIVGAASLARKLS